MAALITRCPACGTMFKVVPDQLKISQGWVRCGHCTEVFDASAHLQPSGGQEGGQPEAKPHSGSGSVDKPVPSELAEATSSLHSGLDDVPRLDEPDSTLIRAEAQELIEDPRDRPFELRRQDLGAPSETDASSSEFESSAATSTLEEPTFVRQAREQERWQRPAVRAWLAFLLAALGVLLGAQVAIHDRDRLAAAEPALRPWLAALCAVLDCRIGPPRQIDAIAIDGSSFNTLRPGAYRLQVTLRNQGTIEVAMPALELTLTDVQDQPVARRVLQPRELGAARGALAASSAWSGSVALAVADNSISSRIAGYRLLAFYP